MARESRRLYSEISWKFLDRIEDIQGDSIPKIPGNCVHRRYIVPGCVGTGAWRISGVVRVTARACLLFFLDLRAFPLVFRGC